MGQRQKSDSDWFVSVIPCFLDRIRINFSRLFKLSFVFCCIFLFQKKQKKKKKGKVKAEAAVFCQFTVRTN